MPILPPTGGVTLALLTLVAAIGCAEGSSSSEGPDLAAVPVVVAPASPSDTLPPLPPVRSIDSLFIGYEALSFRTPPLDEARAARWVDSVFATLSREAQAAQLFIVELPPRGYRRRIGNRALRDVRQGVGGFLVRRMMGPEEVYAATEYLQARADVPLFFAADYERGAGRFSNVFTELPSNMALGATRDTVLAAAAGRLTAIESRAVGINLLFAPVVDVNNNPANPIINIRSYGEDPEVVAGMAAAFVREAQAHGVLTTLKHFPGHGNTSVDSHAQMGMIDGSVGRLDSVELYPYYQTLTRSHPPAGVMTAHLWARAFDPEPLPATFSSRLLHGLLRETIGFEGLVVTDDVKMGALNGTYSFDERVLRPLEAGADIVLTPEDLGRAIDVVVNAMASGRLSAASVEASVRRILWAKARLRLHETAAADPERLAFLLAEARGERIATVVADEAVTLLAAGTTVPLQDGQRTLLVQMTNYRESESITAAMDTFATALAGVQAAFRYDTDPSADEAGRMMAAMAEADVVVVALYLRLQSGRGEAGLSRRQEQVVRRLLAESPPAVLITFGNPYAVTTFPEADAFIVAYDQALASVHATARILQGHQLPRGRLPVTVDPYPYGSSGQPPPAAARPARPSR